MLSWMKFLLGPAGVAVRLCWRPLCQGRGSSLFVKLPLVARTPMALSLILPGGADPLALPLTKAADYLWNKEQKPRHRPCPGLKPGVACILPSSFSIPGPVGSGWRGEERGGGGWLTSSLEGRDQGEFFSMVGFRIVPVFHPRHSQDFCGEAFSGMPLHLDLVTLHQPALAGPQGSGGTEAPCLFLLPWYTPHPPFSARPNVSHRIPALQLSLSFSWFSEPGQPGSEHLSCAPCSSHCLARQTFA